MNVKWTRGFLVQTKLYREGAITLHQLYFQINDNLEVSGDSTRNPGEQLASDGWRTAVSF